ncbi:MAG: transcriptional regulator [Nitrososphaeraceae archaeon]
MDASIGVGNLVSHLRMLEKDNLITFKKEFRNNKPHTTYSLTEKRIDEFAKLRDYLNF